jgi:hypothetical protein
MSHFRATGLNNGVVVLLDTLGTKGILGKMSPEEYVEKWKHLRQYIHKQRMPSNILIRDFFLFSDTLVITLFSKNNELNMVQLLLYSTVIVKYLFYIGFKEDLLFRGVISCGEFYTNEEIIIGNAIDLAAKYYEQPDWIGISLTPESSGWLDEIIKQNQHIDFPKTDFVKYDIVYNRYFSDINAKKKITERSYAVNWIHKMYMVDYTHDQIVGKLKELKKNAQMMRKLNMIGH